MLHISICDDERIAVEKMQFLKQYVIRDDELVILDLDMPVKKWNWCLTGA